MYDLPHQISQVRQRDSVLQAAILQRRAHAGSWVLADAASFLHLVKENTHIVDKSGFIPVLAKERANVGFFFPRRMCKSMLFSMTHFFLRIEVDGNGQHHSVP
jgi:hypothetical protein